MKEEEEGGAVILKGARLSDSGAVKCVATNLLGRATSAAQLIIEGNWTATTMTAFSIEFENLICLYLSSNLAYLVKTFLPKFYVQ